MPSTSKQIRACLEEVPDLGPGAVVYDLGSAWGGFALALAKALPDVKVIGFETSPFPYLFSKLRLFFSPIQNLEFKRSDFYSLSLDSADLLVTYLYPGAMKKLEQKLAKPLHKDFYLLSHTFALASKKPLSEKQIDDFYHTKVYLYHFCGNKARVHDLEPLPQ